MWFFTFILANILGRPIRSALTLSGVGVAVAAVVALVGVSRDFERSMRSMYREKGIDLLAYQAGKVQLTSSALPQELGDRIAQLPDVQSAAPCLYDVLSLLEGDILGVPVQGLACGGFLLEQFNMVQGRRLNEQDRRGVLLGASLAKAMQKRVGDTVELLDNEPFHVIGVFDSFNVFENGAIVVKLEDLQKLMLREHEVTVFSIIAKKHDRETLARVAKEIKGLASGVEASLARDVSEKSVEMRMARSIAWLTSTIALVIGSIGMLNTMLMAVFERTREFAMLRAIGWRKRRIITMVLLEAIFLSLLGAVVGSAAAMGLTSALSRLTASGRLISGEISPDVFVQGFGVALLLGLLGGAFPAYFAARLPPIEGLRHD